jgi:hypothetical protein
MAEISMASAALRALNAAGAAERIALWACSCAARTAAQPAPSGDTASHRRRDM